MSRQEGHIFEVEMPDGSILEIDAPSNTPAEKIRARAGQHWDSQQFKNVQSGSSTAAQPNGLMDMRFPGMPSPNDLIGVGKGAGKALGDFVQTGGQWMENIAGMPVSAPRTTQTGRDVFQPNTRQEELGKTGGQIGLALAGGAAGGPTMAGQMAAGGLMGAMQNPDAPAGPAAAGMVAPPAIAGLGKLGGFVKALATGTGPAVQKFDQVMGAAKNVPLDVTQADDVALRAMELAGRGAKNPGRGNAMPKVLSDYIRNRELNNPITYEVGRDFAKNSGRLSASEKMNATGEMEAVVSKFSQAMKDANREAAKKVGMGDMYDAAMKEYHAAASAADKAATLKKWGVRAAMTAALGATGAAGYKALAD